MFTIFHDANHCACHNATERVVNHKKLVVNVEKVVDTKKLVVNVEKVVDIKKFGVYIVNFSYLPFYHIS